MEKGKQKKALYKQRKTGDFRCWFFETQSTIVQFTAVVGSEFPDTQRQTAL